MVMGYVRPRSEVYVRCPLVVPASLSNLGPGFDVLGLAVSLYNRFEIEGTSSPGTYRFEGRPIDPEEHLLLRTLRNAERAFGCELAVGVNLEQLDRVPRSRGLGSSATARVAGALAWVHLSRVRPPMDELLDFLAQEEGHPDNVVAAMLGGVTAGTRTSDRFETLRFEAPAALRIALAIPSIEVSTDEARRALPDAYGRGDAVFNGNRLAFLMFGLTQGDARSLRIGQEDRLHHPYRAPLIGPVDDAIGAACAAGAASAFISGSGSTLAALVLDEACDAHEVASALAAPFGPLGVEVSTRVVTPSAVGAWRLYLANAVGVG